MSQIRQEHHEPSATVVQQALDWHAQLLAAPPKSAPSLWAQQQQWLQQDASHVLAWERICQLLPLIPAHAAAPFTTAIELATPVDLPGKLARQVLSHTEQRLAARRQSLKAFAVAGVSIGGSALIWRGVTAPDWQTANGEQRTIQLADGTQILLNTATAVTLIDTPTGLINTPSGRQLQLLRGEVRIQTGLQPLTLLGTWASFTPLGTDYAVRQNAADATLTVSSGQVRVQHHNGSQLTLSAGQSLTLTAQQLGPIQALRPAQLAWQRGLLVAENQRLADFLAELDRYHPGHLRHHPSVADLRITGTFPATDSMRTLRLLSAALPIHIGGLGAWWVTVSPRKP